MDWKLFLSVISIMALLSAGLTILGYSFRPPRRKLIYLCKPLATILIFVAAVSPGSFPADPYALFIGIGLLFSLSGDIWEMLDRRHFLKALISFLITHGCYTAAFLTDPPAGAYLWPFLPLALIGAGILAYLWPALSTTRKPAVGAYVAVIVVMVALASGRALAFPSGETISAAVGALLFLASDAVLAVNRFRRPVRAAQVVILCPYFAGQLLIALSVGLRTLS